MEPKQAEAKERTLDMSDSDNKVVVDTTITRRTRKKGASSSLGTADITLTSGQEKKIDLWMDEAETVRITMQPIQKKLFDKDKE